MFDITSWIRETIFRRPKLVPSLAGEELSEKQTTKLGYFLLICMFFAIMSSAEWSLSIIQNIPKIPTNIPYCVNNMVQVMDTKNEISYNSYSSYEDCTLVSENPQFDFTRTYNTLLPWFKEIQDRETNISELESNKRDIEYKRSDSQSNYNTSLTEKIAWETDTAYNSQNERSNLRSFDTQIQSLQTSIEAEKKAIWVIKQQYASWVHELKNQLEQAQDAYQTAYLQYRLIIAVLSFIFAILVFVLIYRLYVRQKLKNSPHTIIFSVATFAYWLIIIQIAGEFLWDIIPHKFLELLLGWISLFTPLLFLVQFLWPIFIIAIFGFLVYRIQKRLYSPMNILKRFIADKKCPNCGNAVDITKPYCPLCSHEIQISCPHCHVLTMKGMPHCSNCGKDL